MYRKEINMKNLLNKIFNIREVKIKEGDKVVGSFYLPKGKDFKTHADLRKERLSNREVIYV